MSPGGERSGHGSESAARIMHKIKELLLEGISDPLEVHAVSFLALSASHSV